MNIQGISIAAFILFLALSLGECSIPPSRMDKSISSRATILQHIEVLKQPGDSTTIWFWNVPEASIFDGIAIESSKVLEGPFKDISLDIPKAAKSVTFPAPDGQMFYRPYYYKTINGAKTKVASSNLVEVSIGTITPPVPVPVPPLGPAPIITAR